MSVKPIPEGYHSVTPSLTLDDASAAIDFYKRAFGATELYRLPGPGGKVMHAELKIGNSHIMLSDEFPDCGALSPKTIGGCPSSLLIYVEDVDAAFAQAIKAGATEKQPLTNQFWGDRIGSLMDPYGFRWSIATHIEDVSPEEIQRRFSEWMEKEGGGGG